MTPGPVELLVLTFPGERVSPAVVDSIVDVVTRGDVTILDLFFFVRGEDGKLVTVEMDDAAFGFGELPVERLQMASVDDVDAVRESLVLDDGCCAAVLVFEHTWMRRLGNAAAGTGVGVGLHLQIPAASASAAMSAALASPIHAGSVVQAGPVDEPGSVDEPGPMDGAGD